MNAYSRPFSISFDPSRVSGLPRSLSGLSRVGRQGKYVERLQILEEENKHLKNEIEQLKHWRREVDTWMWNEFGVILDSDSGDADSSEVPLTPVQVHVAEENAHVENASKSALALQFNYGNDPCVESDVEEEEEFDNHIVVLGDDDCSSEVETDRESGILFENTNTPDFAKRTTTNTKSLIIEMEQQPGPSKEMDCNKQNTKMEDKVSASAAAVDNAESDIKIPLEKSEVEDNTPCDICGEIHEEEENLMIFCDGQGCNLCVHQACYGVPEIPEGDWNCRTCARGIPPGTQECFLCPVKGGSMTPCKSPGRRWAHLCCTIWIPELTFGSIELMEPVINLEKITRSRFKLKCSLCSYKRGVCIQCSYRRCLVAYHVTCGMKSGLIMYVNDDGSEKKSFCQKHTKICKGDDICTTKKRKTSSN